MYKAYTGAINYLACGFTIEMYHLTGFCDSPMSSSLFIALFNKSPGGLNTHLN